MKYVIRNNMLHLATCKRLRGYIPNDNEYVSSLHEAAKRDPLYVCTCVRKEYNIVYRQYIQQKVFDKFCNDFCIYLNAYGVYCERNYNDDILVKTQVESWIVAIISVNSYENTAEICLYHKNTKQNRVQKCGTSLYPEYHVQYNKKQSMHDILRYILKHEHDKYRVEHDFGKLPRLY